MNTIKLDGNNLTLQALIDVSRNNAKIELSDDAIVRMQESRRLVDDYVNEERVVYGITTGFGLFADVVISKEQTKLLQKNLILADCCSVGEPYKDEIVRAAMLLRINALAKGFSGIRLSTVQLLIDMLNCGIHPIIPEKGSVGASGDLSPLAHIVLVMLGSGEARYKGEIVDGLSALKEEGLEAVELVSKEGLALINGTCVLTAVGALATYDAIKVLKLADISASLTIEALGGIIDAYDEKIHLARPHQGQIQVAQNLLNILKNSQATTHQGEVRVQDAYTLRCIPQIHGASRDAIDYCIKKVEIELNSATDNPLIFAGHDQVISGGNFHGQPMAIAFDVLGIAMAEIGNVTERRIERMVNPALSGLPAFLVKDGGLNTGFMVPQYTAAALVSENKVLAHPACVDSIPTSANQEDHVSMGSISARQAGEILDNVMKVLAIELMTSAQAIEFGAIGKLGRGTKVAYDIIRSEVTKYEDDRIFYKDMNACFEMIQSHRIVDAVEKVIGELY